MSGDNMARRSPQGDQPRPQTGRPHGPRWHRGPKGGSVMDLLFKVGGGDGRSATLRSSPGVVLVAEDSDTLDRICRQYAIAIFEDRGEETLQELREAGLALPEPEPAGQETRDPAQARDLAS